MKKGSSIGEKLCNYWQEACSQSSRIGFFVSQDELTHPRAYITFWSAPVSDGRGVSSDIVMVCWLDRGHHKGRAML